MGFHLSFTLKAFSLPEAMLLGCPRAEAECRHQREGFGKRGGGWTWRGATGGRAGEEEREEAVAGVAVPEASGDGSAARLFAGERPLACTKIFKTSSSLNQRRKAHDCSRRTGNCTLSREDLLDVTSCGQVRYPEMSQVETRS